MKAKPQPKVFKHAACVIAVRHDGIDVIDPSTGRWQHFKTMRSAKWSATVFSRLATAFGHDIANETLIDYTIDQLKA